jgi:moderate conductance mechanosensitive channel
MARCRPGLWQSWARLLGLALALLLLPALTAAAQTAPAAPPTAASPTIAAPTTPPTTPSTAELQTLVETLQDEQARAALVAQLQALIAAQRTVAVEAEPAMPTDFVARLSQRLNLLASELLVGLGVLLDAPRLVAWANHQITDPATRARWLEVIFACAIVLGSAVLGEWLARRVFARIDKYAPAAPSDRRPVRMLLAGLGGLIEILPVVAFALGALVAMAVVLPPFSTGREAIRVLVWATIAARLILAAARATLVPHPPWPSLVPVSEETRNYLMIWTRRFTYWTVFGRAVADAAWSLGVPAAIYALMLKGVGLVLAALAILFILQNREIIGAWIAGKAVGEVAGWGRLRRHLGGTWHIFAIIYISAIFGVYALHYEGGSAYVLRATALSIAALVVARLLVGFVERLSKRGFAIAPDLRARFPQLEQRANRYLPFLNRLTMTVIYGLAGLAILGAWGLASFAWIETELGRSVTGAILSSALVVALALAGWEVLSAAIERNLAALDQAGAPSRARRRTLLPLLRTTILIVIVVISGLIILSQIGINIAPLLAGAGVIGLAVGFGSQALIKDIITGLFILVEDQIAVGDIVEVGRQNVGVVEAITMRTIRLRDVNGIVHTVPFGEVTTVKNLTKDFAHAVVRVSIAYGEDIDRVVEILRGACDELAEDPEIGPLIINRFDYMGVDSLNEFSLTLLLRVRTVPGKQFVVVRALNRLIKMAFDKNGISIRDPSPVRLTGPAARPAGQPGTADDRGESGSAADDIAAASRRRTA